MIAAALLTTALVALLPTPSSVARRAEPVPGRFVVIGHLYPILGDPDRVTELLGALAAERAERVFVLGDSDAHRAEVVERFRGALAPAQVIFAPGNHDFFGLQRPQYLDAVGYLETVDVTASASFVVMNTSESAAHLRAFLERALAAAPADRPVILLGHHRIWNDTYIDAQPYSTHKCYAFAELASVLDDRVTAIFSGNVNRLIKERHAADSVFTCDVVDGIEAYACGMAYERIGYVVADLSGAELAVRPRVLPAPGPTASEAAARAAPGYAAQPLSRRVAYLLRYKQFWVGAGCALGAAVAGLAARRGCRRIWR